MNAKKKDRKAEGVELKTPKGMHDLLSEEYFRYQGFFEKAEEVALYYGFQPIETPMLEKEEFFSRSVGEHTDIVQKEMYTLKTKGGDRLALRPEGTVSVMRAYHEHGMHTLPQPVLLYYKGPFFRHDKPQRGRFREFRQFGVEAIGSDKSIIDALVIKLFATILEEAGIEKLSVNINSLGDATCRTEYKKALSTYFKKHLSALGSEERELLKHNPLRILDTKNPDLLDAIKNAPESIDFLQGPSKQHFREVMEYLESMGLEYQIDSTLVRGLDYYSRTVFEIIEKVQPEEEENGDTEGGKKFERPLALAGGGRYDTLSKMLGGKKAIPAMGAALGVDRILAIPEVKKFSPRVLKKAKVFFIQLGFDAKLKSLPLIDGLRRAKISIRQSLSKDKLSVQLASVEKLGAPWVIILGEKEVIDGTVIVRNMENRSQQTVPQNDLVAYLKKHIAQ